MFVITAIAVVALLVFVVAMITEFAPRNLFDIAPDAARPAPATSCPFGFAGRLGRVPVYGIWFFLAVEGVPLAAEETRDPKQDMPRGLIAAMLMLLVLRGADPVFAPGRRRRRRRSRTPTTRSRPAIRAA